MGKFDWVQARVTKVSEVPRPGGTWLFHLMLPRFLAEWDIMASWERNRFQDMRDHLKKGDILFDIGAEYGWQSAIYAQMVGPENMVLVEPSPIYWPGIKQIWEHNEYPVPKAAMRCLFSDKTTEGLDWSKILHSWPEESEGEMMQLLSYQYVHEHGHVTPQITLDEFVQATGIVPNAITMDTEGAESIILHGAADTLTKYSPIVWASLHPDMSLANYGETVEQLEVYMNSIGYKKTDLGADHEIHSRWDKR